MPAAPTITLRPAGPGDELAVLRLAALDSQAAPRGPHLLAEEDGELVAAISLSRGSAVADPFRRTDHLVSMLRSQAAALQASRRVTGRP